MRRRWLLSWEQVGPLLWQEGHLMPLVVEELVTSPGSAHSDLGPSSTPKPGEKGQPGLGPQPAASRRPFGFLGLSRQGRPSSEVFGRAQPRCLAGAFNRGVKS